ncbi:MAG: hypothetical protein J6J53_05905 [Muribaculaceae bacterium]|nr:hypothetical protein [Muribaculaceae bacterium]
MTTNHPTPQGEHLTLEQPLAANPRERKITLGFPSGLSFGERRFPLTPEGAVQLTERGYGVKMETGAGEPIHYSDRAYLRAGVELCDRAQALRADIIISPAPLRPAEAAGLHRGALLLTLLHAVADNAPYAQALQSAGVNVVAADLISREGHRLVADILHEIDGCASMAVASALLADPIGGKGILLGGVTGIVPCEVCVIGSGMGAIAAAHNALGLGATVRMFDDDLYSLRTASRVLGHRTVSSAMHPKVLHSALRSADVVVVSPMARPLVVDAEIVSEMKKRVLVFDITATPGSTFPSIGLIDMAAPGVDSLAAATGRACYCNLGCRVPRTAAMALSNALVANVSVLCDVLDSIARAGDPLRRAMLLCWGKCVHPALAETLGTRPLDINFLTGN